MLPCNQRETHYHEPHTTTNLDHKDGLQKLHKLAIPTSPERKMKNGRESSVKNIRKKKHCALI